jgi:hypothetical protein
MICLYFKYDQTLKKFNKHLIDSGIWLYLFVQWYMKHLVIDSGIWLYLFNNFLLYASNLS